jgi:hypothetical protein
MLALPPMKLGAQSFLRQYHQTKMEQSSWQSLEYHLLHLLLLHLLVWCLWEC